MPIDAGPPEDDDAADDRPARNHTPDFSRRAAVVLGSAYFSPDFDEAQTPDQRVDAWEALTAKRDALFAAIDTPGVVDLDDLPPDARAVWDRAENRTLADEDAADYLRSRFNDGYDDPDTEGEDDGSGPDDDTAEPEAPANLAPGD